MADVASSKTKFETTRPPVGFRIQCGIRASHRQHLGPTGNENAPRPQHMTWQKSPSPKRGVRKRKTRDIAKSSYVATRHVRHLLVEVMLPPSTVPMWVDQRSHGGPCARLPGTLRAWSFGIQRLEDLMCNCGNLSATMCIASAHEAQNAPLDRTAEPRPQVSTATTSSCGRASSVPHFQ